MAFYVKRELDYGPSESGGIVNADLFDAAFDPDVSMALDATAMDPGNFTWEDPTTFGADVGTGFGAQNPWEGNMWDNEAQRRAQEVEDELMELV